LGGGASPWGRLRGGLWDVRCADFCDKRGVLAKCGRLSFSALGWCGRRCVRACGKKPNGLTKPKHPVYRKNPQGALTHKPPRRLTRRCTAQKHPRTLLQDANNWHSTGAGVGKIRFVGGSFQLGPNWGQLKYL